MKIINKYYNINKLNKTIVLISDIHYYDKKDIYLLNKVLDNIKHINPDYVCIAGDITDKSYVNDEDYLINWLKKLSNNYKTIGILGNHEYYIDKKEKDFGLNNALFDKLKNIDNLYLLQNNNVLIDNINFIGLDLGIKYYFNENKSNIDINKYIDNKHSNVLLCHSPEDIDDIINGKNIDLVLCGHMHGGIVPRILRPLFKTRGIISPTRKFFPQYAYGLKKVGGTCVITSNAIRVISHINKFYMFRFLFSSEIVVIK